MRSDRCGGCVVERAHRVAIGGAIFGNFCGERVVQRQLGNTVAQIAGRDGARIARGSILREMHDNIDGLQYAYGFHGDQLGIARPDPDPEQPPDWCGRVHAFSRASALMAAAVMALPPSRPRTIRNGTFCVLPASASFDSAAPTNPTGMPRIAAGRGAP